MFACIHAAAAGQQILLECASAFSPVVEDTAPGTVVLKVDGLAHLFGFWRRLAEGIAQHASRLGVAANVAIASNPDTAVHAALGLEGTTVVRAGEEARMLAGLPIELLPPPAEIAGTFALWGIRTFGELAALPAAGIAERLGSVGLHLQKLARGAAERPLVPASPPEVFEEALELEYPVALLEPLAFLLARLLGALCARLETHGLATHELRLALKLEDASEHTRALRLPFPMRDQRTFLKLLQLDLEAHPPAAAVVRVALAAEPVDPRVVQYGLFVPLAPEPQKLELTLARIAAIVGEENVGSPELVDTHRPGAFHMRRFGTVNAAAGGKRSQLALRVFRPPLPAKVITAPGDSPVRVLARGVHGRVLSLAGPWRTSGDWWSEAPWARDEWDVAVSGGALYRIYLDRRSGGWFLEGSYD